MYLLAFMNLQRRSFHVSFFIIFNPKLIQSNVLIVWSSHAEPEEYVITSDEEARPWSWNPRGSLDFVIDYLPTRT